MFYSMVQRVPEADAIIHGESRVTYEKLWNLSCSVAQYLNQQGMQKDERVSILLENSAEYVAIYYGAQAAGGVAVGLNTAAKARDLENWIRHCGATWLFANESHPELLKLLQRLDNNVKIIILGKNNNIETGNDWNSIVNIDASNFSLSKLDNPNTAATIIYTSGTTGSPKGVTLSHKNLVSNIQSILAYLKLSKNDRILNVLPFYYTYGNSVLHTHLSVGGSIILENSMMYPNRILEKIVNEKVTGFSGVPSTFALLLGRTNLRDYDLSSVRYMTQAGGPMPPAKIRQLMDNIPHIKFFVMYGQTEASARLTYLPPEQLFNKIGSIGKPIPGVEIEIRDEYDNIVCGREIGEICARGNNIMLGYWEDMDATNKVIKNGWLHTGDLAHQDADGYIYIDGRSSEMIKTGANRISPKEIEEIITEIPQVQEAVVVGVPDEILGQIIKAVIVIRQNNVLKKLDVQSYCKNNLADYKVPKIIEFTNEIPKTSSGKIQRFKLQ